MIISFLAVLDGSIYIFMTDKGSTINIYVTLSFCCEF